MWFITKCICTVALLFDEVAKSFNQKKIVKQGKVHLVCINKQSCLSCLLEQRKCMSWYKVTRGQLPLACTTCTWKPEWDSAPTLVSCPGRGRSGNETGWTRVSKFEMMSVLHRGKSTILQTFPAEDVVRWKERLSTAPPEGRHSPACKCLWYLVSDLLFKKIFFWALYCFLVSRSGNLTLVVYFYLLLLWFLFSFYSHGVPFWSPWSSYSSRSAGDTQEGEPHLSMTNQLYQSCEHKIHSFMILFSSLW